jgi:hypothetical protein
MKEFWVDYCASVKVQAEDEEKARDIFHEMLIKGILNEVYFNEIMCIEEVESEEN